MTDKICVYSLKNPCAILMETDVRGVLEQSWSRYETQGAHCTTCSDIFAQIMVLMDSTSVDMYEKVNVQLIILTEGRGDEV
jgi:7-cyano-7-deazaguanine synthase in queuosine biosynthesis